MIAAMKICVAAADLSGSWGMPEIYENGRVIEKPAMPAAKISLVKDNGLVKTPPILPSHLVVLVKIAK
jgi:hypothetical protein